MPSAQSQSVQKPREVCAAHLVCQFGSAGHERATYLIRTDHAHPGKTAHSFTFWSFPGTEPLQYAVQLVSVCLPAWPRLGGSRPGRAGSREHHDPVTSPSTIAKAADAAALRPAS